MLTGDSLAIFTTLTGLAVGSGVAAYTVSGSKARNLWIFTGLLLAAAMAWAFKPSLIGIEAETVWKFVLPLVPIVTVSLVAILVKDRRQPAELENVKPPAVHSGRGMATYNTKVAVRNARSAMADRGTDRTAEKALPSVKAAMLTLTKEFGVRFPKPTGKPQIDLETFCRIIEEMMPYISASHDDAAREVGEAWIRKLEPRE